MGNDPGFAELGRDGVCRTKKLRGKNARRTCVLGSRQKGFVVTRGKFNKKKLGRKKEGSIQKSGKKTIKRGS